MTVYNMPLWLRRFTFNRIQKHFNDQNEEQSGTSAKNAEDIRSMLKQAQAQGSPQPKQSKPQVKVPDFVTSTRKASQKWCLSIFITKLFW